MANSVIGSTSEYTTDVTPTMSQPSNIQFELLVHPNTALLSMSLTLFTFSLAYYLKGLRNKKVLGRTVRMTVTYDSEV